MPFQPRLLLTILSLALASRMLAASEKTAEPPPFTPVAWSPLTGAAIGKANIDLATLTLAPAKATDQIGDAVTVLVQATTGREVRQWAVQLRINGIKPEEQKLRSQAFALHTSSGHKIAFEPSPLAGMLIHVLGPYSSTKGAAGAKDIWSGALVNPNFLRLGLNDAVALFARLDQEQEARPGERFQIGLQNAPFPAEVVAREKPAYDRWGVTEADERAFIGMMPALTDFFRIISQTEGVREIMFEAIDVPWWALVKNLGRMNSVGLTFEKPFEQVPSRDWGLPNELPVYTFRVTIQLLGKPALVCRFAVTEPRVPLLNTAGIIGIAAGRPDGKGPKLMIRVLAGHPAAAPTAPTVAAASTK